MKLAKYLKDHKLTHQEFASRIGSSQAAVSRYAAARRFPEAQVLARIQQVTKGQVTANDFVPEPTRKPRHQPERSVA